MKKLIIKGLSSSFVAADMKLAADKGSGEAKLFVGSMAREGEYDAFFSFDSEWNYAFSKENLLVYLQQMKLEYVFQAINKYKNVSEAVWQEKYNTVQGLPEEEFKISLRSFKDKSRYYIRADEDIFKRIFRSLAIPKITNVVCLRDEEQKIIYLTLEINSDYSNVQGYEDTGSTDIEDLVYLSKDWFIVQAQKYHGVDEETARLYHQFQSLYSPEKLRALTDEELLGYMFLGINDHSMCNALEYDPEYSQFGSIAGAIAYNYFLFYSKNDRTWKTAFGEGGQRSVSPEEALTIGKQIRDALVQGADIIASCENLATVNDYSTLLEKLNAVIPQFMAKMWCLKYYHMIFPHILPVFYSEAWQKHILCNLNIIPSDARFIRMGQLSTFSNECGISSVVFSKIIIDNLGAPKTFYRIGTGDNGNYFEEWRQCNYVAIGWNDLGDLSEVYQEDSDAKTIIVDALKSQWNYDNRLASRKYGEINNFYSCVADTTYVVAMAGQKLYAIGAISGGYFYDEERAYAHCRPVRWLKVFSDGKTLPFESEGKLTTFVELKNPENLCFLYQLLYGTDDVPVSEEIAENEQVRPISFCTGYASSMPRNRILFGAPGTGKSHTLNEDVKKLVNAESATFERVTFHPEYSYASFVGCYKPVSTDKGIDYKYVAGPFMRVLVEAYKSGRTDSPRPHILLIEELNRARVAAVFGEVFQLLDRDADGVSEYEIAPSEDIKKYLVEELGGSVADYDKIQIPNNMFIWATMNSADQGVFPMDTAFKRRWNFEYIGIDNNDSKVQSILKVGNIPPYNWNQLRKAINAKMSALGINEDKLLGPYFISKHFFNTDESDVSANEAFVAVFKNKVLMYLFEDACKQKAKDMFEGCDYSRYSRICDAFDKIGIEIFGKSFESEYYDKEK